MAYNEPEVESHAGIDMVPLGESFEWTLGLHTDLTDGDFTAVSSAVCCGPNRRAVCEVVSEQPSQTPGSSHRPASAEQRKPDAVCEQFTERKSIVQAPVVRSVQPSIRFLTLTSSNSAQVLKGLTLTHLRMTLYSYSA